MKLSIIIVSWNVRALLEKCLVSLFEHPLHDSFEVIVVDNASQDGSVRMVQEKFPQVKCMANQENLGFSRANNMAYRESRGEYLLLLNPDACVHAGALDGMVSYLERHDGVGIVGGKLLNADGSLQPSVRTLPTFWQQFFVNKLLGKDPELAFDYTKQQEVDQVMGAFLVTRRSLVEHLGFLDERFFIWMEDVDFCKRVKEAGYKVIYLPSVVATHQRSSSFNQQNLVVRQIRFNKSSRQYYKKHHGMLPYLILTLSSPLSLAIAWGKEKTKGIYVPQFDSSPLSLSWRVPLGTFLAVVGVEFLSLLGYGVDPVRQAGFFLIVFATFFASMRRLEYGVMIAVAELMIGSKGYLFSWGDGVDAISVRIGIFCATFLAWIIHVIRTMHSRSGSALTFATSAYFNAYILLATVLLFGAAYGLVFNERRNVLLDANAWAYFLVTWVWYDALVTKESVGRVLSVAYGAIIGQIVKVCLLLYVMAHPLLGGDVLLGIYRWVRVTGVGEITQINDAFYRVFLQSQVYIPTLLLILVASSLYFLLDRKKGSLKEIIAQGILHKSFLLITVVGIASFLLSFSRSFWLAFTLSMVLLLFWCVVMVKSWRSVLISVSFFSVCTIAAMGFVAFIVYFPIPSTKGGFQLSAFSDRFADLQHEAAAASRWSLLPELGRSVAESPIVGHGFGKTITYISRDPRVLEMVDASGKFTTYAFEWGYLDIVLKMGAVGLLSYLILLGVVFQKGFVLMRKLLQHVSGDRAIITGLWFGLLAVGIIHMFTPYLNHPLGIAYVVFVGLVIERMSNSAA